MVTCSGAFKSGSLRVVRNGVSINEHASVDLRGIRGIWSLTSADDVANDKYVVMSFVGQTRILSLSGEEMEEIQLGGFKLQEQTLYCGNLFSKHTHIVQVTSKGAIVIDSKSMKSVSQWTPPGDSKITVAHGNSSQLLVALGGGKESAKERECV